MSKTTDDIIQKTKKVAFDIDQVYYERNVLLSVLSKILPSHLAKLNKNADDYNANYEDILCIHLKNKHLAWHLSHMTASLLFSHLSLTENDWDGIETTEKYQILSQLKPLNNNEVQKIANSFYSKSIPK